MTIRERWLPGGDKYESMKIDDIYARTQIALDAQKELEDHCRVWIDSELENGRLPDYYEFIHQHTFIDCEEVEEAFYRILKLEEVKS